MERVLFIDKRGETVLDTPYFSASSFSEGLALVMIEEDGPLGFINVQGDLVIRLEPGVQVGSSFSEGVVLLDDTKRRVHGAMNRTGSMVIPFGTFGELGWQFSNGLCRARRVNQRGEPWGYIDIAGQFVIHPMYPFATEFSEGFAAVGDGDEKNGYIDLHNEMVTPRIYFHAEKFSQGLASVVLERGGLYGAIDVTGKTVIPPKYHLLGRYSEGLAEFSTKSYFADGRRCGFIDRNGDSQIDEIFEDAARFSDGLAAAVSDGALGFVDQSGSFVIPPRYQKYMKNEFSEGLVPVKTT